MTTTKTAKTATTTTSTARRMRAPLVPSEDVLLNLDVRQTGLGGASCGPEPMSKYRFNPKTPVEWTLKIERVGK